MPKVPSAKITDVAKAMMSDCELPIVFTGIRSGEKIREIMVSGEECYRRPTAAAITRYCPISAAKRCRLNWAANIYLAAAIWKSRPSANCWPPLRAKSRTLRIKSPQAIDEIAGRQLRRRRLNRRRRLVK
ncbi:MAG: hypothetical protein C4325_09880 [Blastocatellia bacterium]